MLDKAAAMLQRSNQELNITNFNALGGIRQTSTGEWEIITQSWTPKKGSTTEVYLVKGRALVKNLGDKFEYKSWSQSIEPTVLEEVLQGKYVMLGEKALLKRMKNTSVEFGNEDSRHTISAVGNMEGVKKSVTTKELSSLMHISRGLLHNISFTENKLLKKK